MDPRALATLTLIGVLAVAPVASAGTTTSWYLFGDSHGAADHEMQQGSSSGATTTEVTLADGDCALWGADQAAEVDVTFNKDQWTGDLESQDGDAVTGDGSAYQGAIGSVASDGTFTAEITGIGIVFEENGPRADIGTFTTSGTGDFTVPAGDFLAFEFCNQSGQEMLLFTAGKSKLQSPSDQPSYPTFELATLGLTALGLVGVGLIARRRS